MRRLLTAIARRVPPVGRIIRQRDELSARLRALDAEVQGLREAIECVRPCVIVIEYNSSLPPDSCLVQPYAPVGKWDGTDFYGASLGAICELAATKGYTLVHCELTGVNAFFVRDDLAGPFGDPGDVPRRGPNILLVGGHHRPDPLHREYIDVRRVR